MMYEKLASGLPDHDALVLDDQGQHLGSVRVNHTPEGLGKLNGCVAKRTMLW
jgi:hypothetical protein